MEKREKSGEDLDCSCQTIVTALHQQTMSSSFELTKIIDIAESIIFVFENSEHCAKECRQTPHFVKPLLDSIYSLMMLFDIVWYYLHSEQESEKLPPRPPHSIAVANLSFQRRTHISPAPAVVTGYQTPARIESFVFDEVEKQALLEEILRGLTTSMNNVVKTVQQCLPRTGASPHTAQGVDLRDLCREVLDKTYSAKGRYQVHTHSLH